MEKQNRHSAALSGSIELTEKSVDKILIVIPGNSQNSQEYIRIEELVESVGSEFKAFDILAGKSNSNQLSRYFPSKLIESKLFQTVLQLKNYSEKVVRYDAVHIVYNSSVDFFTQLLPFVVIGKFFGKKVIIDNRNRTEYDRWHRMGYFFKRTLKMADYVLVLSDYQKQLVKDLGKKSGYIPSALKINDINPRSITNVQPKIMLEFGAGEYYNPSCVVKAYSIVKQKYPRSELVMSAINQREYQSIPGISFFNKSDRASVFEDADIYINSTRYDFLEPALLEAMAHGIPVISSPISFSGKFENGKNIIFFRYNDHNMLADAVLKLVEDQGYAGSLSSSGVVTAQGHDWSSLKQEWLKVYRSLQK